MIEKVNSAKVKATRAMITPSRPEIGSGKPASLSASARSSAENPTREVEGSVLTLRAYQSV